MVFNIYSISIWAHITVMEMLKQIMDSFFSKLWENLVEGGYDVLREKMNLKSSLDTLERNSKSLSDKAFDFEEKIKNAVLSGKKKRKREVEEWLKQVKIIENEFRTLNSEVQTQGFLIKCFNGDQVTQLNAKVQELVEQSRHFGELLVNVYETRGEALLTTNLSGKGFKENLKRIWNLLKSDKGSSIGIYGMGGVGKTALARHINNIIFEKRGEKRVCWITASQVFSIKKLQDEIARFIGIVDLSDEDDEDKRAARLNKAISLTGNNFILILDDVWEYICLQKLGDPLRLEGCRLILTTRSFDVCCRMGCQEKVEVKKLPSDAAWNLFKQKLDQDIALCPEIENIAKGMVKVCDGLPLGIIVLAGSMRGETEVHGWRNELEKLRDPNMVQDDEEDEVFKVLKYSFDRLDLNHKLCFLQCSLYPEDHKIEKKELVERFISEELVDIRKSRQSQFDQGYSILNKLVKICLLESVNGYGVKMHDLVRAMALKITKGKNMVISGLNLREILNEGEWTKDLEKVSLMHNSIMEISDGMSPDCPNLTTLILCMNPPLRFIADSFFSKLDNLCILDLSHTRIEKVPNSLSNLENLKVLNLQDCSELVDIPDLGNLKKLRELHLSETAIKKVPQGMEELNKLRFLSLHKADDLDILPKGLFLNLPLLERLHLPIQIKAPTEEIMSLKNLQEFWGRVESVSDIFKYIRQSQLAFLNIILFGEELIEDYFSSPCHEKELYVSQCDLKNEEMKDLIHHFQSLRFQNCEGLSNSFLDYFGGFNKPCSFKELEIDSCIGIECILTNEQCILTNEQFLTTSQEFESRFLPLRNLELVILEKLPNFTGIIQNVRAAVEPPLPQAAVFSSLRLLYISQCNKMRKLGLPLSEFQNLKEIDIQACDEIEEIIKVRDGEERVSLPKLKMLSLYNLPRLKSICNTRMVCGSLEYITLSGCPELKKMPLDFDPTSSSLKGVWMDKKWLESLEYWEHLTHSHLLHLLKMLLE